MIRKSNGRLALCYGLLTLLLAFIWGNSLLPGQVSGAISDWVKEVLSDLLPFLFSGMTDSAGGGLLRKMAHFTEFAALGSCFCWLYAMLRTKQYQSLLLSALSGLLAACIDETIQRFVPDRHGCLTDVLIESAGVITGIVLFAAAYHIINKNKNYLEETT